MDEMVPNYGSPQKRRKSRRITEVQLSQFLKQVGRKAQLGREPNDRGYSRRVEAKLRRMRPEDIDELMRADDEF
jgi:hypothetical protein